MNEPTQPATIMVVSNDVNLRHWVRDHFGGEYEIAVCTDFLEFTAELKWQDRVRLILLDCADERFDIWEIVEILDTTHPSLPFALLTANERSTDEVLARAPHKKIIALYQPLEVARAQIGEILEQAARARDGGGADGDGASNLTAEIERLKRNLAAQAVLSESVEKQARSAGFEGVKSLRRFNAHLENILNEWNHAKIGGTR